MIGQGFVLMFIGMFTVFLFLSLLVVATSWGCAAVRSFKARRESAAAAESTTARKE